MLINGIRRLATTPQAGELVEIEGITDPGDFAPRVHAVRIARLGTGELPPPVHPYWDQLYSTAAWDAIRGGRFRGLLLQFARTGSRR